MPREQVALITGANTGIGLTTAVGLVRRGVKVFLACRSRERTEPVLNELRASHGNACAQWLPLDLADLTSVSQCAEAFLCLDLPLHLLINNAGAAGARGLTRPGFEWAFGVHHIGHFLLTRLLLERLIDSAPARVVTVASRAHARAAGIDWEAVRRPTASLLGIREYCTSKLANVLFSAELSHRLAATGVTTYALHPGVVDSDIWRRLPAPIRAINRLRMIDTVEGARTTLYCALSELVAEQTGLYYSRCQLCSPGSLGRDMRLAKDLWWRSDAWIAPYCTPAKHAAAVDG
jgi:NAD(P)-dependent dehydrogenase (short-subunit alcohol dehydrogenase family)